MIEKLQQYQQKMKISSTAFENNGQIPPKYTCQGLDISPELKIENPPAQTVSFALIMDDPDAGSGTWNHWLLWNIPAETTLIPENVSRDFAVTGNNSWPKPSYGGPCPPTGNHRYFFKVFALNSNLDLPAGSTKEQLLQAMEGKILEEAQLMGTYKKS